MSLFEKKKTETKVPACACNGDCPTGEVTEIREGANRGEAADGICCIRVLGSGCKNCHALLEAAKEASASLRLGVEVEYVTDMEKVMEYGVISMPALVVNAQVVSMGKVLNAGDVEKILKNFEK